MFLGLPTLVTEVLLLPNVGILKAAALPLPLKANAVIRLKDSLIVAKFRQKLSSALCSLRLESL
jgi:hypothetical protein